MDFQSLYLATPVAYSEFWLMFFRSLSSTLTYARHSIYSATHILRKAHNQELLQRFNHLASTPSATTEASPPDLSRAPILGNHARNQTVHSSRQIV